jgi:hypothetical protein
VVLSQPKLESALCDDGFQIGRVCVCVCVCVGRHVQHMHAKEGWCCCPIDEQVKTILICLIVGYGAVQTI